MALLCATMLGAQSPTIDSSWTVNVGGVFFTDRLVQYANGSSTLTRTRLGDTTQLINTTVDQFKRISDSWATDVEYTSSFPGKIREFVRQDQAMLASLGRSPIKSIVAAGDRVSVDSTYKIKSNGSAKTIRFSVTAAGVLRYKIDTFTIRTVSLLGGAMRLNNYLNTGASVDLYRFQDGRWRDATRSIQVYLQSEGPAAQNRAVQDVAAAPIEGEAIAAQEIATFDGGIVFAGGKYWKWNASKKAWVTTSFTNQKPIKL